MKTVLGWAFVVSCVCLSGCGMASSAGPSSPPPPAVTGPVNDLIREGDRITVRLTGVPDGEYVIEVQVPSSGDITVPLLTRPFHAAGRPAVDVAQEISSAYKTGKIYTNPVVTIIAQERYVSVGGDVRGPSRVLYSPDLTLLTAINACGGFTEYADRRRVHILRGKERYEIDCVAALRNPGTDPPVYPGDQITVPRTPF